MTFSWGWISRKFFLAHLSEGANRDGCLRHSALQLAESSTADSCKDWYLLTSKICGIPVSKFMSRGPLVASLPSEFASVPPPDIINVNVDRKGNKNEEVAVGSLFGVVKALMSSG